MNGQMRNTRPKEGVKKSSSWQFNEIVGVIAAVKIVVFLRPYDSDRSQGSATNQKLLVGLVPSIKWPCCVLHPAIFRHSADLMPPGLKATGNALKHPQPGFRFRLADESESRFTRLIESHAF